MLWLDITLITLGSIQVILLGVLVYNTHRTSKDLRSSTEQTASVVAARHPKPRTDIAQIARRDSPEDPWNPTPDWVRVGSDAHQAALATPGLAVRSLKGQIDEGFQG